jgi:phospholipid transport system substrate-binding protein
MMHAVSTFKARGHSSALTLALVAACLLSPLAAFAQDAASDAAQDTASDVASARAVVRSTLDEVLDVLVEPDWTSEQRVAAIEKIAYARFDFELMSKLVLGKSSYKKFSEAQLDEFQVEFKAYLSRTYGGRIDNYERPEVKITGDRALKRGNVLVNTEIKSGQTDPIKMDYVLRDNEGSWKVIDVVIEGVSLVRNFRSQFKEIVNGKDGPEGLLRELRTKNAAKDAA